MKTCLLHLLTASALYKLCSGSTRDEHGLLVRGGTFALLLLILLAALGRRCSLGAWSWGAQN
jgi:hypothetical protein